MLNPSGITPTEFKVLVEPKPVEVKTKGGIILPDQTADSEKYAAVEGRIVALSHLAFSYATSEEWGDKKPKPGQRILHAKYAGVRVKGKDGNEYLLINDKDVCALTEE